MKKMVKVILAAAAVVALAVPAMAADKLKVMDSTGTTPVFVVTDDGMFGLNTSTPTGGSLQLKANKLATYNDVLGGTAAAGMGVDIDTGVGTIPSGALQAASFSFLVRYPAASITNNFNTFRMIARTDTTVSGTVVGQFAAANFQAQHQGSNTANYVVGFVTNAALRGTGDVTTAVAVDAATPGRTGTGTIGTAIGINIRPQKITGVTAGYALSQNGVDDINLFNGSIQIPNLPVYADNTAAVSLPIGTLYRTATGVVMVKY